MNNRIQALGKIIILSGGWGAEREISLMSGREVHKALQSLDANCEFLDVQSPHDVYEHVKKAQGDRVFIAMHGEDGESGFIQAILQGLNIPYTGSGVAASALTLDKIRCKWLWQGVGLPTPDFMILEHPLNVDEIIQRLGLPLFVKPACNGSSIGISKVKTAAELIPAFELAKQGNAIVFAEKFLCDEYTVGIINNETLPSIKIETPREFYDYQAKYFLDDTVYLCPAGLTAKEEHEITQLALRAFQATGCEGYGRVDIMRDEHKQFKLIEINPLPGLTTHSLVPKAARYIGIEFPELIVRILEQTQKNFSTRLRLSH
ncbi:MAG: D-alanine--D-alanine ligase [Legionellales bacterium]|nr:D-alanine--D-alanine ligase [Legionellales bacterium]